MTTSNNGATREARRRKIVERGSDRLAFVTGRIQDLPNSTPPPFHHISSAPADGNREFRSVSPNAADAADSEHLTGGEAPVQTDSYGTEVSNDATSDVVRDIRPSHSLASSELQTSTGPTLVNERFVGTRMQTRTFFTPSQISSAVAASKLSRLFGSVAIAILVLLSYLGHSLIGDSILKSITSFRPLYLLLVTDLTLVLAWIFFNNQRVGERPLGVPSSGGNDRTEQVGKILEAAFALQKAVDALVMDCSIYTIITVCGLSLFSRSIA